MTVTGGEASVDADSGWSPDQLQLPDARLPLLPPLPLCAPVCAHRKLGISGAAMSRAHRLLLAMTSPDRLPKCGRMGPSLFPLRALDSDC